MSARLPERYFEGLQTPNLQAATEWPHILACQDQTADDVNETIHESDYRSPKLIQRLERRYQRYRRSRLGKLFDDEKSNGTKAERTKFIREFNDRYYGASEMPNPAFFREQLLPLAHYTCENDDDFSEELSNILEIFDLTVNRRISANFYESFFALPYDNKKWKYRNYCHGNYAYFRNKYGIAFARFVARIQCYYSDYHGDGITMYKRVDEIEEFAKDYESIPFELRDTIYTTATKLGPENFSHYLRPAIDLAVKIANQHKTHLIPYAKEILGNFPKIYSEYEIPYDLSDDDVIDDLEYLHRLGPVGTAASKFLGKAMSSSKSFSRRSREVEIRNKADSYGNVNIERIVSELSETGYTEEETIKIFNIPERCKWMGKAAISAVRNYTRLVTVFPGGWKGFIKYARLFKKHPRSLDNLVNTLTLQNR